MSDDATKTPKFKVTDRRAFASDGTPRHDPSSETGEHEPSADEAVYVPAAPVEETEPPREEILPPDPQDARSHSATPRFNDLVSMLATQALMQLGEMGQAGSGTTREELQGAQLMIDLLEVLSDKTQGNLDPTEEQSLRDVLYDLRMRFLAKAKVLNF